MIVPIGEPGPIPDIGPTLAPWIHHDGERTITIAIDGGDKVGEGRPAVVVGGLGSIWGSFVAAVLIGVSDIAGKYYVPRIGAFLIYLVMILLLMWRPNGLFGKR